MWVKIDDRFPDHYKVFKAATVLGRHGYARATSVWVQGMCYVNRLLTDGFLPSYVVQRFYDDKPAAVASALVGAGLWELADGGYQVHDYHDHNPSATAYRAYRQKKQDAGRAGGQRSAQARGQPDAQADASAQDEADAQADASENGEASAQPFGVWGGGSKRQASLTRARAGAGSGVLDLSSEGKEREKGKQPTVPLENSALVTWFERVYAAYPNKAGKMAANTAWVALAPSDALAQMILGTIQSRAQAGWKRLERRFIPQLKRFIDERMWDDEPTETLEEPWENLPEAWVCTACGEVHESTKGDRQCQRK